MATPLGHLLAGAAAGAAARGSLPPARAALVAALAAAAPDLDFLPGILLGDPARFHHGASHSLGFVLLAALPLLLLPRVPRRWAVVAAAGYATHLALDLVTLDNSLPRGIPLLWPLSSAVFQSPVALLPNVQHTREPVVSLHNLRLVALELLLFVPLLAAALAVARRGRGGHGGTPGPGAPGRKRGAL